MRGMNRTEREDVVDMLSKGIKPADISKQFDIPLSTITTWNKDVRAERKARGELHPDEKSRHRERMKLVAKILNDAEAKITTAISEVINPNISDQKWMEVQQAIVNVLKDLAMKTAEL